ncbi:MAG: hypothetical protein ACR2PZ_17980 [Pseudomonadales bacterium]
MKRTNYPNRQDSGRRSRPKLLGVACLLSCLTLPSIAAEPISALALEPSSMSATADGFNVRLGKAYALGVNHYHLDHETKVTGWRVGERWFFGRQRGMDSGLTLVWQKQANQVSVSKDGLRLTRRF